MSIKDSRRESIESKAKTLPKSMLKHECELCKDVWESDREKCKSCFYTKPLVTLEDAQKLETERDQWKKEAGIQCTAKSTYEQEVIPKLEKQIAEAKRYVENLLVEHNVSFEFIENYGKKLDPEHKEEWVATVYLKELRAILRSALLPKGSPDGNANQKSKNLLHKVLANLTSQQCKALLVKTFGEKNAKYHTLDEIPLNRLIAEIRPNCNKEFTPTKEEITDIKTSEKEIREGKCKTFETAEELIKDLKSNREATK